MTLKDNIQTVIPPEWRALCHRGLLEPVGSIVAVYDPGCDVCDVEHPDGVITIYIVRGYVLTSFGVGADLGPIDQRDPTPEEVAIWKRTGSCRAVEKAARRNRGKGGVECLRSSTS